MKIKNSKMSGTRKFLLVEAIFVLGVLTYLFFSTAPNAVSPIAGKVVLDPDFVFEIENGNQVLISKDPSFTNVITLNEGEDIVLPPGTYYWKVKGLLRDSPIYEFVIEGHVGLNLREGEEKDILENAGNVPIVVERKKGGITSGIPLEVGESEEVEKEADYKGEQK